MSSRIKAASSVRRPVTDKRVYQELVCQLAIKSFVAQNRSYTRRPMNEESKRILAWLLVITGLLGTAVSYSVVWLALHIFVPGLSFVGFLGVAASAPVLAIGAVAASRKPQIEWARLCSLVGLGVWAFLFALTYYSARR
jgi:hypothetical protein